MKTLKKEVVRGNFNGKKSTFTVELVKVHDGFSVNFGDNKGWGVGYKTYERCSKIDDAANAYYDLVNLIQL